MLEQRGPADRDKGSLAVAGTGLSSTALEQLGAACKHAVTVNLCQHKSLGLQARAAMLADVLTW